MGRDIRILFIYSFQPTDLKEESKVLVQSPDLELISK